MATVSFTPNLERHVEPHRREDRGESWSVVSHHLPPARAVAFVE